jgi:hypothetical protein
MLFGRRRAAKHAKIHGSESATAERAFRVLRYRTPKFRPVINFGELNDSGFAPWQPVCGFVADGLPAGRRRRISMNAPQFLSRSLVFLHELVRGVSLTAKR